MQAMSDKIFVNYRRENSIGTAGRLRDRLAEAFGEENLFMDIDNIPAGVDFAADLNNQVTACRVFLAVIGPNWLDMKDESGVRQLDNPDDFVTIEIAAALARGDIRVIPVLVDNARMPKADKLPDSIKPLVRRNAVELRNSQFRRAAEMLVARMRGRQQGQSRSVKRRPDRASGVCRRSWGQWHCCSSSGAATRSFRSVRQLRGSRSSLSRRSRNAEQSRRQRPQKSARRNKPSRPRIGPHGWMRMTTNRNSKGSGKILWYATQIEAKLIERRSQV